MSAERETVQGTALWCDPQGVIRCVLRDDLGWAAALGPGQPFTLAIHRDSFQQALDLLAELRGQGAARVWELAVWLDGRVLELSFSGLAAGADLLIVATRLESEYDTFLEALAANNEKRGRWSSLLDARRAVDANQPYAESFYYEQFSRLSNEMAVLQRELARRNAALERAEAALQSYANQLEQQVSQRTAALIQAEKLALAGRLAAALAHEIGNPLQAVIGLVGMMSEALVQKRDISRYVDLSLAELRRMSRTLSSLRNLYHAPAVSSSQLTSIESLLAQVLALTEARCTAHRVRVVHYEAADLPAISVVPDQITQVLLNLVLNAVDAMPDGGLLEARISRTPAPLGVSILISDQGVGIAPEALPHIFEPFYTTKPEGMGLGLYISQEIVHGHGGRLEVASQVGEGTRFTVWLPVG